MSKLKKSDLDNCNIRVIQKLTGLSARQIFERLQPSKTKGRPLSERKEKTIPDIDKLYPRPWYISDGRYICAANSELVADLFEDSPQQAKAIGARIVKLYNHGPR